MNQKEVCKKDQSEPPTTEEVVKFLYRKAAEYFAPQPEKKPSLVTKKPSLVTKKPSLVTKRVPVTKPVPVAKPVPFPKRVPFPKPVPVETSNVSSNEEDEEDCSSPDESEEEDFIPKVRCNETMRVVMMSEAARKDMDMKNDEINMVIHSSGYRIAFCPRNEEGFNHGVKQLDKLVEACDDVVDGFEARMLNGNSRKACFVQKVIGLHYDHWALIVPHYSSNDMLASYCSLLQYIEVMKAIFLLLNEVQEVVNAPEEVKVTTSKRLLSELESHFGKLIE